MFITPAVAGETVYIGSCAGRFYAFDAATGAERWVYDTAQDGTPAQFHGDALLAKGRLFVGSDTDPVGHLYAFDLATGRPTWKLAFPGGVQSQVLGRGELIYAQTVMGEVWAIDGSTSRVAWVHHAVAAGVVGQQVDPVLAGDRLIVGWHSGDVEALDTASGDLLWRVSLGHQINTSLVVAGDSVLVAAVDGKLHRVALADGRAGAAIALGGYPVGDLVVAGRCLLVLTVKDGYSVSCRDAQTGESVWSRSFTSELSTYRPLILDDEVVVGYQGRLLGLHLDGGGDAWSCPVDGVPRGLNVVANRLYVGMLGGLVTAMPLELCRAPTPATMKER